MVDREAFFDLIADRFARVWLSSDGKYVFVAPARASNTATLTKLLEGKWSVRPYEGIPTTSG